MHVQVHNSNIQFLSGAKRGSFPMNEMSSLTIDIWLPRYIISCLPSWAICQLCWRNPHSMSRFSQRFPWRSRKWTKHVWQKQITSSTPIKRKPMWFINRFDIIFIWINIRALMLESWYMVYLIFPCRLPHKVCLVKYKWFSWALFNCTHIDGLAQDCSDFIADALGLPQSWTKPSILPFFLDSHDLFTHDDVQSY